MSKGVVRLGVSAILVTLVVTGLWYKTDGSGKETTISARSYSSLDHFLAAAKSDIERRPPVVVIGIDGASWAFIDPLIAKGELPNFARIKAEGSFGALRSVPCHFSPPAWVSMFTGYEPGTTGIRTFGKWVPDEHAFVSVDADRELYAHRFAAGHRQARS